MRVCIACRVEKPESEFARSGLRRVLRWQCRLCYNALCKGRYARRRKEQGLPRFVPDAALAVKRCRKCGAEKPRAEFHKRGDKGGLDSLCKLCQKARTYAWRAAHPASHAKLQRKYVAGNREKVLAGNAKWRGEHPEYERNRGHARRADPEKLKGLLESNVRYRKRRAANGGKLTREQVKLLLSQPCAYCGGVANELDHVIPVSRGGAHGPENVVPACRSCNARKSSKTPEEWKPAARREGQRC